MIRFVLLDLDDTLLDFHRAEREALSRALTDAGISPSEEKIRRYSAINDMQWKRLERGEITRAEVKSERFRIFFREEGISSEPEETAHRYEHYLGEGHWFVEGAEEVLKALFPIYGLYLVSNGTLRTQRSRLESAGIARYFRKIFISEVIGANKPDPAFFRFCFAKIPDFDPAQTIIVGDSLTSDILGGNRSGIHTCYFCRAGAAESGGIYPEYRIHALSQLPGLLSSIQ